MELTDTINFMDSPHYRDRMLAEYSQLKIRHEKLNNMIIKHEAGTLEFEPTCPMGVLIRQEESMREYLRCLQIRAEIEGIDLH